MGAAEHRIRRVVFEIGAPGGAAFDHFAEALRARFDAVVLRALEAALDEVDKAGEPLRLDRVEVDLSGLDPVVATVDELARRIVAGIGAALPAARRSAAATRSMARDDADELAGFLESGELPWAEPGRALDTLLARLAGLDEAGMRRLAAQLRAVLIRRRAAERLVRQLPAQLVRRIFRALLPEALAAPTAAAFGPDRVIDGVREARAAPGTPVPDGLVATLTAAIHQLARDPAAADLGEILGLFAALDERVRPDRAPAPTTTAEPENAPPLPAPVKDQSPRAPEAPEPQDDTRPETRSVHGAGAVLLHPFLGAFFDQLGLLSAPGRFRDGTARTRAVLLAHHLATGSEEAPEPECVLFKLLSGVELAESMPRSIELTETERAEAEALLVSVIAHWKRLGSTSPAGLREAFLLRPGRLERRTEGWHLTVERRGVDVLLDGLPWMLSRVQTPFMAGLLTVDWR